MVETKRKFFELRNGLKAVDFRNKDYYDRIDDHDMMLYWYSAAASMYDNILFCIVLLQRYVMK